MLTKLLKYDLKYMIKNMVIFYILAIIFSITTRILFSLEQTFIINIIGQISVGCLFSMLFSILINVIMRSWVRFRDSIYKDEGYLTNTLPVTKNDIYNSKFIQTLLFFVFSFTVVIICLFITYYTKERWLLLKDFIGTLTTGLNFNTGFLVFSFISVVFVEIFNAIQCGFLGIILGFKKNNNKIAYSALFGFIAYFISQNAVLFLMFIVGLFNGNIMDLFFNEVLLDPNTLKLLIILAVILYVIIISIMNLICKDIFNKGVDLE